jgi:hypothetical protein
MGDREARLWFSPGIFARGWTPDQLYDFLISANPPLPKAAAEWLRDNDFSGEALRMCLRTCFCRSGYDTDHISPVEMMEEEFVPLKLPKAVSQEPR